MPREARVVHPPRIPPLRETLPSPRGRERGRGPPRKAEMPSTPFARGATDPTEKRAPCRAKRAWCIRPASRHYAKHFPPPGGGSEGGGLREKLRCRALRSREVRPTPPKNVHHAARSARGASAPHPAITRNTSLPPGEGAREGASEKS